MDQTDRYNREVVNPQNLSVMANAVSAQIRRVLTKSEIADLMQFVKSKATGPWNQRHVSEIRDMLVSVFVQTRFTESGRASLATQSDIVDIHEILKKQIGTADTEADPDVVDAVDADGNPTDLKADALAAQATDDAAAAVVASSSTASSISSGIQQVAMATLGTVQKVMQVLSIGNIAAVLGKKDDVSFQTLVNPKATYRDNWITLDSRYRDTSSDIAGGQISQFLWYFQNNSAVNSPNGVASVGVVQNVVSIMSPSIRIPYVANAFINTYNRITMLISEFSGQANIAQEGRKYHFIYSSSLDGNMIECGALPDMSTEFKFAKSITQIDTLTATFGSPLEPVVFDMDRQTMAIQYTNPGTFTSAYPHNLQTGDQVYVTTFTTMDPVADSTIIATVNEIQGFNVFVVDDYTIQFENLDLTQVTAPINPYSVLVYFGSKRFFVPIRIRYIVSGSTNSST